MFEREDSELHQLYKELRGLVHEVRHILRRDYAIENDSLRLTIPDQKGAFAMGQPASLVMGGGSVNAIVTESLKGVQQGSFQNGVTTGILNGPPAFTSDAPGVATVDPVLGTITPVSNTAIGTGGAAGVATITATDAVGALSDTVVVTVLPAVQPPPTPNDALQLSVPAQAPASGAAPASAVKKLS